MSTGKKSDKHRKEKGIEWKILENIKKRLL